MTCTGYATPMIHARSLTARQVSRLMISRARSTAVVCTKEFVTTYWMFVVYGVPFVVQRVRATAYLAVTGFGEFTASP